MTLINTLAGESLPVNDDMFGMVWMKTRFGLWTAGSPWTANRESHHGMACRYTSSVV